MSADLSGLSAGELSVRVVSDTGRLDKDVAAKVNAAGAAGVKAAEKSSRDIAGKMNKIGNVASLGMTLPLLAVGKAAKDAASDVIESQNKTNVVFGESAAAVTKFADGAAKLGIAKSDALAAASGFGALFTTMKIGQPQAAKMSTTLTGLGADMASFSNSSPEEALQALQSGLNGESEPLRRFGVFLNEDRVAAEALALGLAKPVKNAAAITAATVTLEAATARVAKAVKEHGKDSVEARQAMVAQERAQAKLSDAMAGSKPKLTEAQKAQARYSLILKDTKLAQGDVERSAKTSAAVQESISKAQTKNAHASLGKALIPLSITASKTIGGLAEAFNKMGPGGQKAVVVTAGLLAVLGPLLKIGSNVGKVVGLARKAIESETAAKIANAVVTKTSAAAQWLLNAAMSANPIMLVVLAIVALVAIFVIAYKKSETFRNIVQGALRGVLAVIQGVFGWVKKNWPLLLAILTGPIGLAVLAIVKNWDKIKGGVTAVYNWIRGKFDAVVSFVAGLPKRIAKAAKGMWDGISNAFKGAINFIIRGWNNIDFKIPGFKVGPIGYSGFTLGLPDIPELAAGALVRRRRGGVLARIAEGGEDEVVAPLSKLEAMLDGSGAVFQDGAIRVYNPAPEPGSESVDKRLRRLAVMGAI